MAGVQLQLCPDCITSGVFFNGSAMQEFFPAGPPPQAASSIRYPFLLITVSSATPNLDLRLFVQQNCPLALPPATCQLVSVSKQKVRACIGLNLRVFILSKFTILWSLCPITEITCLVYIVSLFMAGQVWYQLLWQSCKQKSLYPF